MNALSPIQRIAALWLPIGRLLDALRHPAALLGRLYIAQAFFLSGLTKIQDWDTTLLLFTEEYHVPLLPPGLAAVMGTAGELALPVLLVLGLGGRFAALGLSVVNVMAVLSLSEIAPAAFQQHITWGVLLAALALFGPGLLSVDAWLGRRVAAQGPHGAAMARGVG
ncbi:MAG: DoxX family protein [Hydrogenophaga sp.]|uniref:DoxX family protein n=1 Tax=Hydrogenophaga sp. TaxID=1904254 RepID=UPI001DA86BE9|nr:DoxX family protein [Hydrogenophaga sp.]MBX3610787.1 DoxX family protein [Hydrogenophaga sp.]